MPNQAQKHANRLG